MNPKDHTILPPETEGYCSPDTGAVIKTIVNPNPAMATCQEHLLQLPELCPASHNPGSGSTLRICYTAREHFLEVFSLSAYIKSFIGHPVVRDVEKLTQTVARDCAILLKGPVSVEGCFELPAIGQRVVTSVQAE